MKIFNESITSGVFPSAWNESLIIPVLKDINKSDIRNYRLTTVLDVFAKTFDCVVYHKTLSHIFLQLAPEQHGFMLQRQLLVILWFFFNKSPMVSYVLHRLMSFT